MKIALDANGNRTHISGTCNQEKYFCPLCGEELILRKGEIRAHHFAHKANTQCNDGWHYDMSEWHSNWQDKFPVETQEVVKRHDGKKHRADVLIESIKTVIEFQHSPLSPDEFEDRNAFYNELGYRVVWLFDVIEQYEDKIIDEQKFKNNIYIWKRPRNTLRNKDLITKNDYIFLEFEPCGNDNHRIKEYEEAMRGGHDINDLLTKEEKEYFNDHKDDEGLIVKVAWISDQGFKRFAADEFYSTQEFVDQFYGVLKSRKFKLEDAYDKPRFLYSKDHSDYYYGCPISNSKRCVSSSMDIPESTFDEIMPCEICKYAGHNGIQPLCYKKIVDLNLPKNIEVSDIERYDEFSLKSVTVKFKGQEKKYCFKSLSFTGAGETICDLWKKENPRIAIFKNIRTGYYIKVTRNPVEQILKYRKVYGYFSKNQYSFGNESKELYGAENKEWVLVWKPDR